MKVSLLLILDKIFSLVKGKQEHDKDKIESYSRTINIAFIFVLVVCVLGYFFFPYTFKSDSWPVQILLEILEYIKNS